MPKITAPTLEAHRAETVGKLLDAYAELVRERGYDAVSLSDVAARVGLARTAIYNYFRRREELLLAWTDREVMRSVERLIAEVEAEERCADKLRAFVRLQLESFITAHLPPGREAVHFLGPDTYERFMQHVEPVERILGAIIDEGVASGEFGDVDPADTVRSVLACIAAERGPLSTGAHYLDQATEQVTAFLLRALAPAEGSGRRGRR